MSLSIEYHNKSDPPLVTIFWQNICTQSISMHFQCLSMICSLWQQNWLHSVITQKICKFICKQSRDFGVQKSMYISTGYLILKCKNDLGLKNENMQDRFGSKVVLEFWGYTMRKSLLNWCHLVSISNNVMFYVFLVVRIY